jgi:parallel beta-helix repeat protein
MVGVDNTPTEPTIDDNVIGHTDYQSGGVGIYMIGRAEPRIIANDIYINETGIEIRPTSQPSILSNNINYNWDAGIRCFSSGASKPVVIQGNHIHSSARGSQPAGIWVGGNAMPIIAQNMVINNDPNNINPDVDYSSNLLGFYPILNLNVYDRIARPPLVTTGTGQYNTTSTGLIISP